ncbi:septum formation protein Maf [Paenibacillus sp. IB182496]|uniref:dTTP/UTP pyrophosphatase n=1 Tax=Paenibacillus sabuli TaxID=2772509 RepID=A0A927GQK6_9BACL|nr:Maf family protein [Paenibacillus sabuli]MBD2844619.1 septum formation protein Maf [Paenibacillus sabuli]
MRKRGTSYDCVVLASGSPRRQQLIRQMNMKLPIRMLPTDADECTPQDWTPQRVVEQLALRKARAARGLLAAEEGGQCPLIIGADTIVALGREVLGKPESPVHAEQMLGMLQGREHSVLTGVACLGSNGSERVASRSTRVRMLSLAPDRIRRYVETGEPMDKAGAYAIQGFGAVFVDGIEGCYFNVVGLPLSLLADMLAEFGIDTV